MSMNGLRVRHLSNMLETYKISDSSTRFLSKYFGAHSKKLNPIDRQYLTGHFYEILKWQGLLSKITPGKKDWPHLLKTYYTRKDWRQKTKDLKIPVHSRYSFPEKLVEKLTKAYGEEKTKEIVEISNEPFQAAIRVNLLKTSNKRELVIKQLQNLGVPVEKSVFSPTGLKIPGDSVDLTAIISSNLYKNKLVEFQEEAKQIALFKCGVKPGMKILDFTASSGSNSALLGAALEGKGHLFVYDERQRRLLRHCKKQLKEAGVKNFTVLDSFEKLEFYSKKGFDLVLVDAPSTQTGSLRKRPELKWKFFGGNDSQQPINVPQLSRLEDLIRIQRLLVSEALKFVSVKKGKLCYLTSSILPEENEEQVKYFCITHNLVLAEEPIQVLPQTKGTNGFFLAILEHR
jgi:16S rRNA (cytosine967-C5)-methyltransferase